MHRSSSIRFNRVARKIDALELASGSFGVEAVPSPMRIRPMTPASLSTTMPGRIRDMEDRESRGRPCALGAPSGGFEWALLPVLGVFMRNFGFKLG